MSGFFRAPDRRQRRGGVMLLFVVGAADRHMIGSEDRNG